MKIRPQVSGPIDVGYGNYILTAPAERQGRKRKKKEKESGDDKSEMRRERGHTVSGDVTLVDGKYDVSELLSSSNTLTNPKVSKVQNKKTEL